MAARDENMRYDCSHSKPQHIVVFVAVLAANSIAIHTRSIPRTRARVLTAAFRSVFDACTRLCDSIIHAWCISRSGTHILPERAILRAFRMEARATREIRLVFGCARTNAQNAKCLQSSLTTINADLSVYTILICGCVMVRSSANIACRH